MSDQIKPAMTRPEWDECVSIERGGGDPLAYLILSEPHKAMCWINGNLPDDDPRKITRADVSRCLSAAELEEEASGYHGQWHESPWRTLAAKLAALLPPEA